MLKYIISAITGALIAVLLMRECNNQGSEQQTNRIQKDTIVRMDTALLTAERKDKQAARDSIALLLNVINRVQDRADAKEQTMNEALAQSDFTNHKLTLALGMRDSSGVYKECAALNKQYELSRSAAFAFKFERDSLLQLWPRVHATDSMALQRSYKYSAIKDSLFDALSAVYDRNDYLLTREKKRRWSIGPSAGYGAGKNGLTPFAGVSVNYSLIRF